VPLNQTELWYSAFTPPNNEAGRIVLAHNADPKPSTFYRKDEDYD